MQGIRSDLGLNAPFSELHDHLTGIFHKNAVGLPRVRAFGCYFQETNAWDILEQIIVSLCDLRAPCQEHINMPHLDQAHSGLDIAQFVIRSDTFKLGCNPILSPAHPKMLI